jgi:hypothetical protein
MRRQRTHVRAAAELPDGVMVVDGGGPALLVSGRARPWSFAGYGEASGSAVTGLAEVLTPPSIVAAIASGYRPMVHESALAGPVTGLRPHPVRATGAR